MIKLLYNFLGLHSILIGLFTFFLPVLLYKAGFSLFEMSMFISVTGGSFFLFLWGLDRIRFRYGMYPLIYLAYILEIFLIVGLFFLKTYEWLFFIIALIYGAYNCFFWVTQRILFVLSTQSDNVGDKFGNIQILAFGLGKVGIFIGSFLLEKEMFFILLMFAIFLSLYGIYHFRKYSLEHKDMDLFVSAPILTVKDVVNFKDALHSKLIFFIDGAFLFFEGFFWVLTLFFIMDENYSHLGLLIIALAIIFSSIFVLIKKYVDKMDAKKLLYIATFLYAGSWGLREIIEWDMSEKMVYIYALIIAFSVSFFRLVFNKQFFHTAKQTDAHTYMLYKSYYSQFGICCIFFLLAGYLFFYQVVGFTWNYFFLIPFSLLFLLYKPVEKNLKVISR
ncbi:MAG: MFS transporter [Candidatus Gracilibacteria bacterium]|nr:MFS transporter [Candidatus Gracilibacteria bacterium]